MVILRLTNFTLLIICMCLQSIYYPTNALRHTIHRTHINSCISVRIIQVFLFNFVLDKQLLLVQHLQTQSRFSPASVYSLHYRTNAFRDTIHMTCNL